MGNRNGRVTQEKYRGDAGEKNPYEPEAVVHGQPSVGGHCHIDGRHHNEDKEAEKNESREEELAGTPADQKI